MDKKQYLKRILSFYESEEEKEEIKKAFEFADFKHKNQKRDDSTPYIFHPLRVALNIAEKGFDREVVVAALLHDVVEDCDVSLKKIKNMFGEKVADMVNLLTKPKLSTAYEWIFADNKAFIKTTNENYKKESDKFYMERNYIYYNRLFNSGNVYALYIKLYDNLDNLTTLEKVKAEKRSRNLKSVLRHTLWLASRLLSKEDFEKIQNNFKKYGVKIKKDYYKEVELKNPIVVLPPREMIGFDLYKHMPKAGTKTITIYGNLNSLFLTNSLEIGFPKGKKYKQNLRKFFPEFEITRSKSLVPKSVGAYEKIYKIKGFRKEIPLIKVKNNILYLKTAAGTIKVKDFYNLDFEYSDLLKDLLLETKNNYKKFKEKLVVFYEKYVK